MTLAPAPIEGVAHAIAALMSERASGIFQLTGPRDVTYADAARFLADRRGADPSLVATGRVVDARLPAGAAPPHTTLDSSALRERYGIAIPDAWDVLDAVARTAPR
jgi:dTDP-4-dehydrorhamnose reductase